MITLKYLTLKRVRISEILPDAWEGLDFLELLWLPDNKLKKLPAGAFRPLTKLLGINLCWNKLTEISQEMWQGLSALGYLLLDGNDVSVLHPAAFEPLGSLTYIRLSKNQLTEISGDT